MKVEKIIQKITPEKFEETMGNDPFFSSIKELNNFVIKQLREVQKKIEENIKNDPKEAEKNSNYINDSGALRLALSLMYAGSDYLWGFNFMASRIYEESLRTIIEMEADLGHEFHKGWIYHNLGVAYSFCNKPFRAISAINSAILEDKRTNPRNKSFAESQLPEYIKGHLVRESKQTINILFKHAFNKTNLEEFVDCFFNNAPDVIILWLISSVNFWTDNHDSYHPINHASSWLAVFLATRALENLILPYSEGTTGFYYRLCKAVYGFEYEHKKWAQKKHYTWKEKLYQAFPDQNSPCSIEKYIPKACLVAHKARNFVAHCDIEDLKKCDIATSQVMAFTCLAIIGFFVLKAKKK